MATPCNGYDDETYVDSVTSEVHFFTKEDVLENKKGGEKGSLWKFVVVLKGKSYLQPALLKSVLNRLISIS